MRCWRIGSIVLLVVMARATHAESDTQLLQGQWRPAVESEYGIDFASSSLTFSGTSFTGRSKTAVRGDYEIQDGDTPKQIDFILPGEEGQSTRLEAIYEFKDDHLKICAPLYPNVPRPTEFNEESRDYAVVVFIRVQDVEGTWERVLKVDGPLKRIVKVHRNGITTLTYYGAEDRVLLERESKYQLIQSGKVQIFKFFDPNVTRGPAQPNSKGGAYVWRVDGNKFYEFRGVLEEDSSSPGVAVWHRVLQHD